MCPTRSVEYLFKNRADGQRYYFRVCSGIPGARLFCMWSILARYLWLHFNAEYTHLHCRCTVPCIHLHLCLKVSTDNNNCLGSLCGHFIKWHSVRPIYYAGLSYHKISSGQSPVGHQDPARLWRISQDILWIFPKIFFRYLFWLLAILWTGERVWPKLCYYLFSGGLVHMPWGSSKGLGIKSLNM